MNVKTFEQSATNITDKKYITLRKIRKDLKWNKIKHGSYY